MCRCYPTESYVTYWYLTCIFSKCSRTWSRLVFRFCNTLGNDRDDMMRQLIEWVAAAVSAGTHNWIEDDVPVLIRRLPRHTFRSWGVAVSAVPTWPPESGNILNGQRRRQYNIGITIIYFCSFAHKTERRRPEISKAEDPRIWTTRRRLGILLIILVITRYLHSYTSLIGWERVNRGKKHFSPIRTHQIRCPHNKLNLLQYYVRFTWIHS